MKIGRPQLDYEPKKLQKWVPLAIYDLCLSLIDAEVQKYKLKNSKK